MNNRRSIADYKGQARELLLGNYGMAVGSFVLIFVLIYSISALILGAYSANIQASLEAGAENVGLYETPLSLMSNLLISSVVGLVINIFSSILFVGFIYILKEISNGRRVKSTDVFYVFKHHPDTVIIISACLGLCKIVLTLPGNIIRSFYLNFLDGEVVNGKIFLIWTIVSVAGYIAYICVYLCFAMSYLVYLDNSDIRAIVAMKKSASIMKGNKIRYAYVWLSMVGYWLLGFMSLGIGCLYVVSYQNMIFIEFYKDICGDSYED